MEQDRLGRCDFLDVLEESVLRKRTVEVRLRDGTRFSDTIVDVITVAGDDHAVFATHGKIRVGDIADVT